MPNQAFPLISVIIPVFNTGKSAVHLLAQLQSDPYPNLEIICVDDGSTDDSYALLQAFIQNNRTKSHVFKLLTQPNSGPSVARNAGISISSGAYLIFIDSDDSIHPEFISKLAKAMLDTHAILAMTSRKFVFLSNHTSRIEHAKTPSPQRSNETFSAYIFRLLLTNGRFYPVNNKIFRADIIRNHKLLFEPHLNFAEDLKFNLSYLQYASGDIKFINQPLYKYYYGTPTSIVKTTALSWSNWQKSFAATRAWAKSRSGSLNFQERYRLCLLFLRWRYSHARNVLDSDLTFRQKIHHARPFWLASAFFIGKTRAFCGSISHAIINS